MKKALPMPLILGAVALVAIVAVFFVYKGAAGPPEFTAPAISKTIPDYVFEKLPPAQQEKMRADGYKVTTGPATATLPPGGVPAGAGPR